MCRQRLRPRRGQLQRQRHPFYQLADADDRSLLICQCWVSFHLSGALEDSNVDIAEELTSMIESQRNYTANSKVFQTGSELMEVLVNLKR